MKASIQKYVFGSLLLGAFWVSLYSCKPRKNLTDSSKSLSRPEASKSEVAETQMKFKNTFYNACKEKIKGNVQIAETLFKECLKLDPANAAAKYELAHIYLFAGGTDAALGYAQSAAQSDSRNEWYQLLFIECLHKKKLYNEAVAVYEKLVKNFPDHIAFYEDLAAEYLCAQKPEKAIKTYDELEKKFGKSSSSSIARAKIYKQEKKWQEAEQILRQLILENPKEPQYYTYLAEIYQNNQQPEKAFQTYQEILKIDPNNPYIHLALADYYREQRKDDEFFKEVKIAFANEDLEIDKKVKILMSYYSLTEQYPQYKENAYELCKIMLGVHPEEAKAHSVYADFLFRDKKYADAKKAYENVIERDNSKYVVWSQLMICESELNDYNSLEKHSTEAIDLFPTQALPYFLNGLANYNLKKYSSAITSFLDAQEFVYGNEPLQVQILMYLGDVYFTTKEFEKSDKAYEEALQLEPQNAGILNNYAYYLSLRKKKLDYAEKLSKRSLNLHPESISYMDTYGWIFYQQGKYTEAKEWLEKALQAGADNRPAILEHYGDVLFQLKENAKALEFWQKAKNLGGNSEFLEKKIAEKKLYE